MKSGDKKNLLTRKEVGISPKLISKLSNALKAVESSSRYPLISGLQLSKLFKDPTSLKNSLGSITIEGLVIAGADSISMDEEISEIQFKELIEVVGRFTEYSQETTSIRSEYTQAKLLPLRGNSKYEHLSSVQAERLLLDAFSRIAKNQEVLQLKIGDYWEEKDIRDPFIADLTFKQLISLQVDNLLKKRSFSANKISGLLTAVDNAINSLNSAAEAEVQSGSENIHLPHTKQKIPSAKWQLLGSNASSTLIALCNSLEEERDKSYFENGFLSNLLRQLLDNLSQRQFLALWFASEGVLDSVEKLFDLSKAALYSEFNEAKLLVKKIIISDFPEEKVWIESLLIGIGTEEAIFFHPYQQSAINLSVRQGLMRIVLLALGATEPQVLGQVIKGYWTLRSDGLSALLRIIADCKDKKEQQNLLKELAPQFPVKKLQSLIKLFLNKKK